MSIDEHHRQHRVGWLRAAVLGANDGIVSTSSLIIGVASANSEPHTIIIVGLAGLVAGAISMAAGEYVSVCSQMDTENADLAQEKLSLSENYELEVRELAEIYVQRGVEHTLATEVARQLMRHDALGAHARDEIGISEHTQAKPLQAALSSAFSFTVGAILPLSLTVFLPSEHLIGVIVFFSLIFLGGLGALSAYLGGASIVKGIARITVWGSLAMMITAVVGMLFNVSA